MTEPLLALVGKTQIGFFKKRTYLLIFSKDKTVLIPTDDQDSTDRLLDEDSQQDGANSRAAANASSITSKKEKHKSASLVYGREQLADTVYIDNRRVSQVTLTASGGKDESLKLRYTLEIICDSGCYEFELENAGCSGMFNLNTILVGLFGKRFTPPGG